LRFQVFDRIGVYFHKTGIETLFLQQQRRQRSHTRPYFNHMLYAIGFERSYNLSRYTFIVQEMLTKAFFGYDFLHEYGTSG